MALAEAFAEFFNRGSAETQGFRLSKGSAKPPALRLRPTFAATIDAFSRL